ncbi:PAS domain S-box protein [Xanthomonadaceae bacterium XH05]|nr:PAS domain S-box protein [Xanthomonadaceae bacterium XH05]
MKSHAAGEESAASKVLAGPGRPVRALAGSRSAASITTSYAVVAMLWIYLSDHALNALLRDPDLVLRWSVYKGLAFVGLTSLLLFLLMRRAFGVLLANHASLQAAQRKLRASETQLASILDGASDAILTLDAAQNIVQINAAAESLFGCPGALVVGRPISRFIRDRLPQPDQGPSLLQADHADGSLLQLEVSAARVQVFEHAMLTLILRDIGPRLAYEAEIERLNRLYAALSQVNQSIVLATSRDDLFSRVCNALVSHGGFRLAWIGWHPATEPRLQLIASAGDGQSYLSTLDLDSDSPASIGVPAVQAFRDNEPYVSNDVDADPRVSSWRDQVRSFGIGAAAAIPIQRNGLPCGTLTLYSAEKHCFRSKELDLLREAANDIAFAIDALEAATAYSTALQRAENERRFSDTMLESMPGIVYFYDEAGRFLRWNRNFELVSGYSGDDIAGMHPLDFFSAAERSLVAARMADVFALGEAHVEAAFVSRDGQGTPFFFTGRRVDYEGRSCLVGVGIDISERHRAERALMEINESLEGLVAERTAELHSALLRAEGADRLKSAFLASMSHELRTPLNSIIGFTGLLLRGLAGPLNDEQSKQLGMVRGSARHLLDLINDVLDISKIEAGQLDLRHEHFDLAESIQRCVASLQPLADRQGLALSVHVSPAAIGAMSDRRRVEQILLNLLNNAIKFTDRGSVKVHASVDAQASGGPLARIRVVDTGVGIKSEDLDQLFLPFRQLDTGLARLHEGTGLGLAICSRLAHLLGGEIAVRSEWGNGSEFTLTLPLERTPSP